MNQGLDPEHSHFLRLTSEKVSVGVTSIRRALLPRTGSRQRRLAHPSFASNSIRCPMPVRCIRPACVDF